MDFTSSYRGSVVSTIAVEGVYCGVEGLCIGSVVWTRGAPVGGV